MTLENPREFFNSPSNRKTREDNRKKSEYASKNMEPWSKGLMDETRKLFQAKLQNMTDGESEIVYVTLFDECKKEVPGAEEAFEIWDMLFDSYKPE